MTATRPIPETPVKPEMKTPWWRVAGKLENAIILLCGEGGHASLSAEERAHYARRWIQEAMEAMEEGPSPTPAESYEAEWINKGCPE